MTARACPPLPSDRIAHLLAVDPGLDVTGVAIFALRPTTTEREQAAALVHRDVIRTAPTDPLPHRCGVLWSELRHLCWEWNVRHACVETPARAGRYRERVGRDRSGEMTARSMLGFHAACGAIYAALAAAQVSVTECPAARLPKNMKRWYVDRWLRETGQDAAANQDVADAIFIGLTAPWDLGGRAA